MVLVSGFCFTVKFHIPLFYISMGHMMGWPLPAFLLGMENAMSFAFTQFLLLIPVVFVNFKYYKMGFKTLLHGSPNMDSLIAIGSSAAIIYGIYAIYKIGIGFGHGDMETVHSFMMDLYFESAGMILTLITLGKTLEARAKSPNVKIGRIRIDGELLPQVLSVGVSALLMQILTLVQQTVIYRVAANYGGENSQILLGAALRFWNFSFVPLWGISQGFQPAAGTNYGAKEYDRVKTLTRVFIAAATILSLVFYIPAELFPGKVLSMFITTPGVAVSGATNFRIMFSTYILQGSFLIAVTLFQSLGKANKATWLVLFRQIILFIPLCIVLPMVGGMGIRGVWLAIALTDAILVVITVLMMLSEFRKMPGTNGIKQ